MCLLKTCPVYGYFPVWVFSLRLVLNELFLLLPRWANAEEGKVSISEWSDRFKAVTAFLFLQGEEC